jgi:hypothetical protein
MIPIVDIVGRTSTAIEQLIGKPASKFGAELGGVHYEQIGEQCGRREEQG